jgi:hypothetical protein
MAKSLTADCLVKTSLRRAMIPSDQSTYTTEDILEIMNEEMANYVLPLVMSAHTEYFVYDEDITMNLCQSRYVIPYRAAGNKLRDIQFVDSGGSHYEFTLISIEDRVCYACNYTTSRLIPYYFEADEIVMMNFNRTGGNLRFSYFLTPSELVEDARGAKISTIGNHSGSVTITDSTKLVSGTNDTISVAGVAFAAICIASVCGCATFDASGTSAAAASDLSSQINAHSIAGALVTASVSCSTIVTVVADSSSTVLTLSYKDNDCNIGATVSNISTTFTLDTFPTHFSCTTCFDFIKGRSPHKVRKFDSVVCSVCLTGKTVTFDNCELTRASTTGLTQEAITFVVGDYILKAEETILPQLPAEIHSILAQRTAIKLLEGLGDTEGMKNATEQLEVIEKKAMTLIGNRADGSPKKINLKHSLLKSSTTNNYYRRRGN